MWRKQGKPMENSEAQMDEPIIPALMVANHAGLPR